MVKKPSPLMAKSRLLPVFSTLPAPNCCATSARRTPLPMAVAERLRPAELNSSANSAREPLKPVVPVLAMLLAVTSRSLDAAFRPLSAILKAIGVSPVRVWFPVDGCGSVDARDLAQQHAAEAVHVQVGAVGAGHAHAGDLAGDVGGYRGVSHLRGQAIGARGQRLAVAAGAVPVEVGQAG